VLELAFYGAEGHIYTSPARFVEEAGGRVLLHELAYSFFWEETGTETALAAPAKRISPTAEVEARFRLALRHKHWDPAFLEYMKRLQEEKPVIFGGDLNVAHRPEDLARPKENEGMKGFTNEEREGIDNIISAGFVDTLREFKKEGGLYTWWSPWGDARARNVGWRIDYVFASKSFAKHVKTAEILPEVMGSDHCPVSITL
jgi:exodeoxyribonuclease-3